MSLERNKDLARRAIQVWSTGDLSILPEIVAADYVNHQHNHPLGPQDVRGLQAWAAFIEEFRRAFPDFADTIEQQVAEGDRVATRFVSRGTQKGAFMGLAATERTATWTGISIDRIENGRIAESWGNWDMMGLFQQLRGENAPGERRGR